jgi:hypothetical protein
MMSTTDTNTASDAESSELQDPRQLLLRYGLWSLFAICLSYLIYNLLQYPFGRDQGSYSMMGHLIAEGGVPYRDMWEQKPPGLYLIYAAAELLFGQRMISIRLLEALGLLITTLIWVQYTRRYLEHEFPALFSALLAALMYVQFDYWHTAQAESFAYFTIVAATFLSTDVRKRRFPLLVTTALGALHGLVFALKPNLAIAAIVTAYLLWRDLRNDLGADASPRDLALACLRQGSCLALGFVAVFLTWFSYVYAFAWEGFLDAVVSFNAHCLAAASLDLKGAASVLSRLWLITPGFTAVGLCCLLFFYDQKTNRFRGAGPLIAIAALQLIVVFIQGKLFEYHFLMVVPMLGVLAGWGYWALWRASSGRHAVVIAAGLLLIASVPLTYNFYFKRNGARAFAFSNPALQRYYYGMLYDHFGYNLVSNTDAAAWIQQNTRPEDKIFVWGFEPTIYFQSEREPASRYIFNLPFRVEWDQEWRRRELMLELVRNRPEVIAVATLDKIVWGTGNHNTSLDEISHFPELGHFIEWGYDFGGQHGGIVLFKRKLSLSQYTPNG